MQHHRAITAILTWSGFLLGRSCYFSRSLADPSSNLNESRRRLSQGIAQYSDPQSIATKSDRFEVLQFVIPEAHLADSKYVEPTTVRSCPGAGLDHEGVVIDVLSIGSKTRPEYLTAQIDTWASHSNVRHFWGVTEREDYDINCDQMSDGTLDSFIQSCKSPMGWEPRATEQFRANKFGRASGFEPKARRAGWFCAQRRPGHALGWLQTVYQNATDIPDLLFLVDDDTSVDIERLKQEMMPRNRTSSSPVVGASCRFDFRIGFQFAFGGFGTFFNRVSIQRMTQPIFCDERRDNSYFMRTACSNLRKNRIGELDVFQPGDSVFDTFYKYSAIQNFCLHSDWAIGYMVSYYSGGELQQLTPHEWCSKPFCNNETITCHNQSPKDMEDFALTRSSVKV